jgi:hypothetical protein
VALKTPVHNLDCAGVVSIGHRFDKVHFKRSQLKPSASALPHPRSREGRSLLLKGAAFGKRQRRKASAQCQLSSGSPPPCDIARRHTRWSSRRFSSAMSCNCRGAQPSWAIRLSCVALGARGVVPLESAASKGPTPHQASSTRGTTPGIIVAAARLPARRAAAG